MSEITKEALFQWCQIPYSELENHPQRKVPFRICKDSIEIGKIMARELVDVIKNRKAHGEMTRAIIPCGPSCWYEPFTSLVNSEGVSLNNLVVFHMDECLDWQGKELPKNHPYNFKSTMQTVFYDPVLDELSVPEENRIYLTPSNLQEVSARILSSQVDITYGGWGQDGHIAYNQARRQPYSFITIDDLRNSTARIQENNVDTIIALAQRSFGAAYQFVPPMSVTLGVKECLSAKKVRVFSDTGAWKQTALRVALFGPITPEYPMTLLQEHPDALLTATIETSGHPFSTNPEWELF